MTKVCEVCGKTNAVLVTEYHHDSGSMLSKYLCDDHLPALDNKRPQLDAVSFLPKLRAMRSFLISHLRLPTEVECKELEFDFNEISFLEKLDLDNQLTLLESSIKQINRGDSPEDQ